MGDTEYLRCIEADTHGRRPFSPLDLLVVGVALALSLFAVVAYGSMPQNLVPRDRVDLVEANRFHDSDGRLVFEQLLFWEWCDRSGSFRIVDWRLNKGAIRPRYDYARGEWLAVWTDGDTLREVKASCFRETLTQFDPELEDRAKWPQEKRRKLRR